MSGVRRSCLHKSCLHKGYQHRSYQHKSYLHKSCLHKSCLHKGCLLRSCLHKSYQHESYLHKSCLLRTSGADPLVCAGPPGPALRLKNQVPCIGRKPDQGVRRRPGGPPHRAQTVLQGTCRSSCDTPGHEAPR